MSSSNEELITAIAAILSQLKEQGVSEIDVKFEWPVVGNNRQTVEVKAKR